MNDANSRKRSLPAIVLAAILASVLFFAIAPNIEETRLEARIGHAYRTVCELAESGDIHNEPNLNTAEDTDPWGQPYRITHSKSGVIVASNGPNSNDTRLWI